MATAQECSPACMKSTAPETRCRCRCGGKSHGSASMPVPASSSDGTVIAAKPAAAETGPDSDRMVAQQVVALVEREPRRLRPGSAPAIAHLISRDEGRPDGSDARPSLDRVTAARAADTISSSPDSFPPGAAGAINGLIERDRQRDVARLIDEFRHSGPGGDAAMPAEVRDALTAIRAGDTAVVGGIRVTRQQNGDYDVDGDRNLASPYVAMRSIREAREEAAERDWRTGILDTGVAELPENGAVLVTLTTEGTRVASRFYPASDYESGQALMDMACRRQTRVQNETEGNVYVVRRHPGGVTVYTGRHSILLSRDEV